MLRAFCSLYRNVDDVCHIISSVVTTEIDEIKDHHALYINFNFILTPTESLFLLISAQSLQLQFDFFISETHQWYHSMGPIYPFHGPLVETNRRFFHPFTKFQRLDNVL